MSRKAAVAAAGWNARQIDQAVQEFVVGLNPDDVREAYAGGPITANSMCFRWATSVVNQWSDLEVGLFVGEPRKSMLEHAAAWRKLTNMTIDALEAIYGPVPAVRIPPTPDDLEISLFIFGDWPEGLDRPRKMPASAEQIASYYVDSAPGLSWENNYHLSTNKSRTLWIFWWEYETDCWRPRMAADPVAYCPKAGLGRAAAGLFLLRAFWKGWAEHLDYESRPSAGESRGSIDADQIAVLIDEIWGEAEE